jgi:8-oxo-dGTP pyrophosphatase MutT (NUDIX family)
LIIQFSDKELQRVQIAKVSTPSLPASYLAEREKLWKEKLSHAQQTGSSLWNGRIYTLEKLKQTSQSHIHLELGTCEYKDILFHIHRNSIHLAPDFWVPSFHYLTVCCIPTTLDQKFVFGVRAKGTAVKSGSVGLIGGTLNQDEREVHEFQDFYAFMRKEIEEETAIPPHSLDLTLFSLNFYRAKYEFLFTFKLPIHSKDVNSIHKNGEFSELLALAPDEVSSLTLPPTDSFLYCRNYLPNLDTFLHG